MSDKPHAEEIYVGPAEAPPARRPPITEIGLINWMRENLFRSWFDAILTLVTGLGIVIGLYSLLRWALLQAQWEVVFLNLRQLSVGLIFPPDQVWRAEFAALTVVFLSLFSVAVWGKITRGILAIVGFLIAIYILVPLIAAQTVLTTFYTYVSANHNARQIIFLGYEGEELTFTLDPLTDVADYEIATLNGYIENNNQQANTSFDGFTSDTTAIKAAENPRDPSQYDLGVQVQIFNRDGQLVGESDFSASSVDEQIFKWTPQADGWYTFITMLDEETSTAGSAWLKIDNLEVFRSTRQAANQRINKFGEPPVSECPNCATEVNRTDVRFEGERSIIQWISTQFAPFLLETRSLFFRIVIVSVVAFAMGKLAIMMKFDSNEFIERIERNMMVIAGVFFVGYLGIMIASLLNPSPAWSNIRLGVLMGFLLPIFLYALIQFLKEAPGAASNGMSLLWLLSIPLILFVLTGFQATPEVIDHPLPSISTTEIGGLLLTLLLSAVAIIASFPIGMFLALGRQSNLPVVSLLSTLFIEVIRGVPLITLLFMGRLILPFFGFGLGDVDLVIRIMVVLTLFMSAYLAEVIRGGLQVIQRGQYEAAYALGLNNFWTTTLIVLPQALRAVIPAIMGQAVSLFKDTSLVYIIGLFEILGTMNQILGDSQTGFLAFPREGYLFIGVVYFVLSYIMADISRRIERSGAGAVRRDTL